MREHFVQSDGFVSAYGRHQIYDGTKWVQEGGVPTWVRLSQRGQKNVVSDRSEKGRHMGIEKRRIFAVLFKKAENLEEVEIRKHE